MTKTAQPCHAPDPGRERAIELILAHYRDDPAMFDHHRRDQSAAARNCSSCFPGRDQAVIDRIRMLDEEGMTDRRIAETLGLSESTVSRYLHPIPVSPPSAPLTAEERRAAAARIIAARAGAAPPEPESDRFGPVYQGAARALAEAAAEPVPPIDLTSTNGAEPSADVVKAPADVVKTGADHAETIPVAVPEPVAEPEPLPTPDPAPTYVRPMSDPHSAHMAEPEPSAEYIAGALTLWTMLYRELPVGGSWSIERRSRWMALMTAIVDWLVDVR